MLVWFKEENLQMVGAKLSYEYIISREKFVSPFCFHKQFN